MIKIDLNKILLQKIEEDFRKEQKKVAERSEELKSLLMRIAKAGKWSLPIIVMGMETHHLEQEKDLDLLEKCGLIGSKVKYTKRNAYREYSVTEKGQALIRQFIIDA